MDGKNTRIALIVAGILAMAFTAAVMVGGAAFAINLIAQPTVNPEVSDRDTFEASGEKGLLVTQVLPGSPAEEAGLTIGDLVLQVEGEALASGEAFAERIAGYEPGNEITLLIARAGEREPIELVVVIGERPEAAGVGFLGIIYTAVEDVRGPFGRFGEPGEGFRFFFSPFGEGEFLMPELEELPFEFLAPLPYGEDPLLPENFEFQRSLLIKEVVEGSPAEEAGLMHGDLLFELNGNAVQGAAEFTDAIRGMNPGDEVLLTIFRISTHETLEIEAMLGEHPGSAGNAYLGILLGAPQGFRNPQGNLPDDHPLLPDSYFRFTPPHDFDSQQRRVETQQG